MITSDFLSNLQKIPSRIKEPLPVLISLYLLFSMVSISLSQIFLSLSLLLWVILLLKEKLKPEFPSFFWPLLVYSAFSLLSSFFSVNVAVSLKDSRELLLYLLIPVVYMGFKGQTSISRVNLALLSSAFLNLFYSFYLYLFKENPGGRITGFMGHYMTQAGILLLFSTMALSMLLFSKERIKYAWGVAFLLALIALTFTLTRSAWIGLIFASCLLLFLFKPVSLVILPLLVALFYLSSPSFVKKRALSIFNTKTLSNKQRIEYLRTGLKIIGDYPLFGTGPDTVEMVWQMPKYRKWLSEEAARNVHLHNNIIQIGAERGLLSLTAWLAFIAWVFVALARLIKNRSPSLFPLTSAALAATLALFVSGMFEYNFADSEVTTLFLYLITIPFAQRKQIYHSSPGEKDDSR